jgi:hypothetical protein
MSRAGRLGGRLIAAVAPVLCLAAWLAPAGHGARPASHGAGPASHGAGPASANRASAVPLGGVNVVGVSGGLPLALADGEVAAARALRAKLVRTEVQWSALEPNGPEQLDPSALAFLDRLVDDAAAGGMRVIATVDSTPCWASSAPASLSRKCVPGRASRANAWPPSDPTAYGAFTAFLARRYGTRLAAVEVWNEPDQRNEDYFAGPNKAQRYAAVLRAAYPAVKQANPDVPVLAGSLVGSNGAFLRALYAAGIRGYYDGLAVHFYTLTLASVRAIHETQLANRDDTPLWLDEFGWSSCWPGHRTQQEQACVTSRIEAANITNTFRALTTAPYVAAEVLYKLRNSTREAFGVLSERGARKPSFTALARVLGSPFGSLSRVTLRLRRRGGRVLASGSGPVGDYMELEAFRGSLPRYRALFVLDRFNRYSIGLPRALGAHGLRVRVFQYWAGVSRGAQRSI